MNQNILAKILLFLSLFSVSLVNAEEINAINKYELSHVHDNEPNAILDQESGLQPSYFVSDQTRAQLQKMDQKFCFFKYYTGAKYPYMIYVDEGAYTVKTLLCGKYENEEYDLIKKSEQLKNLAVLQSTVLTADSNVKFIQTYKGYRETYLGQFVEAVFDVTTILPEKTYTGTVLFDEYVQAVPMKWFLRDIVAFRAVKVYLLKLFQKQQVVNPTQKPLLVLEFEKNNQLFNADDIEFLDTYFELADPADPEIKEYFKDRQGTLSEATKNFGNAAQVGETFGETLMREIEDIKSIKKFKKESIAMAVLTIIATSLIADLVKEPLAKKWGELKVSCGLSAPKPQK